MLLEPDLSALRYIEDDLTRKSDNVSNQVHDNKRGELKIMITSTYALCS